MKTKFNGILTLLLAFVVQISFAQDKTISGTVSDESGPLPGVTVLKKGTTQGTETDFDGNFTIKAKENAVLVFSFIGMKTVERTVAASNQINVQMESDNILDEIVVTAFGIKRAAKSLGYATTTVSNAELTEVSNSNPLESLSGKVAGVDISSPAQPGASTKIIFRGIGSITGSNRPLYVVDGSPITDSSSSSTGATSSFDAGSGINDIDPNNIASINFLKGASASALYGSRAANGVIIITTKKGKNKLKVSISSSADISQLARSVHVQDQFGTGWSGQSFSNVTGEGQTAASNENGSWGAEFNGLVRPWSRIVNNQQLIKPYSFQEDNVRQFYNLGTSFNNSISISGGSENSDVSFTYSRYDVDGIIPTDRDSYLKNNFGINAGLSADKFKIRVSANYANKEQKAVPTGQGDDAGFGKSLIQEMIQIPNDLSVVDLKDRSSIFNTESYFYTPYAQNPYTTLENNNVVINKDRFFGNINLSYEINSNLSASMQIATDIDNEYVKRWGVPTEGKRKVLNIATGLYETVYYEANSPQANAGANGVTGAVQEFKATRKEFDTYLNLNYNKELNENLTLNALAGINYNQRDGNSLTTTVTDLDLPGYYELANSGATPSVGQSDYLRRTIGVYGQVELAYLDKYFLTLTARNDQSSTLPVANNSYFYPSATLAAVLLDNGEHFLKGRASWARIGNDTNVYNVNATAGQSANAGYFGSITYPFAGINAYEIFGRIENQNLRPEITDEIELGLDGRFFNNRIGLDVAFYQRKTTDLIVSLPVARSTGYSITSINAADLTNKGIELALSATPIKKDNFSWDINYTFTKNLSNVDRVNNEEGKLPISSAYGINFYAEEGKPLGAFYGPSPAKTDAGEIIADAATGYYTYDNNEVELGNAQRDFIMGLKNTFKYKNLKLAFSMDWKQGGEMYSYTKRLSYFVGNAQETTYNDRAPWIIPNSVVSDGAGGFVENTTPVAWDNVTAFYNTSQNQAIEADHVVSKTFARLRDLSLSYSLPSKFFNETSGLTAVTFSVYGKNLALWTPGDNTYVDPETTSYGRGVASEFGEFATNPSQRTYGASVKLTF